MIDEKRLIEEIVNTPTEESGYNPVYLSGCATRQLEILDIIDRQPKVGEWIPCSEQEEPTEDGMYLVSGRWLRSGEKVVDSCGFFGEWKCVNNFIIEAWMELPPAYKGE